MSSFLHSPFAIKLGLAFTTLTTVCLLYTTFSGYGTSVPLFAPKQGTIVHMVMFRYQPTLSQSTKNDVASAFLALKDSCRLPDGSRYIVSLDGGSFASPEGRGKGLEHAFVVTFRSKADRDYYLNNDPAHLAFVASILEKVADSTVFDFESGEFERTSRHRRRRPSDELHIRTI